MQNNNTIATTSYKKNVLAKRFYTDCWKFDLFKITNITYTPVQDIVENYVNAFKQIKNIKENDEVIEFDEDDDVFVEFVNGEIDLLDDRMTNATGSQLLCIIDNYIVNFDYYERVYEFLMYDLDLQIEKN